MIGYAREISATVEQTEAVIRELIDMGICEIETHDNGKVTLINRRMDRENKVREQSRLRAERFKEKHQGGGDNAIVTPPSSSSSSSPVHKNYVETSVSTALPFPSKNGAGGAEIERRVKLVWEYYLEHLGKNPALLSFSVARRSKGVSRFKEALKKTGGDYDKAEALMRSCVDAMAGSEFHSGSNDRGRQYNSWEKNLFKSLEQFEGWMERA